MAAYTKFQTDELTLPRRYLPALSTLSSKNNIIISPSYKSGCFVMDSTFYSHKLRDLLNNNTYELNFPPTILKNVNNFKKSCKKLISKENTSWTLLINYHPNVLQTYRIAKTHKHDIPFRLIIAGVGSAHNNISKLIAKRLSAVLGTIRITHINNSGSSLNKIINISIEKHP